MVGMNKLQKKNMQSSCWKKDAKRKLNDGKMEPRWQTIIFDFKPFFFIKLLKFKEFLNVNFLGKQFINE